MFRCDSEEVLDLLKMIADDLDLSSDSDDEGELEWLYVQLAFSSKREKGPGFNIDDCSEVDFQLLFR